MRPDQFFILSPEGEFTLTIQGKSLLLNACVINKGDALAIKKSLGFTQKDWDSAMAGCGDFRIIVETPTIDLIRGMTVEAVLKGLKRGDSNIVKLCAQALIPELGESAVNDAPSILDDLVKSISKSPIKEKGGHVDGNPHDA